ncbi:tRNA nucleotidyltransferase (CCA-adding enzyme) [Halanaeroarchaeum sp. HSR-CO]|uniref:CCA tRNA nucleotidyltransferase n=1 Tax=Halanaeroarchaeum sp. HSR-CO TaxID=2866382 RepID=UPI00217D5B7A|nr:CCA tRNA nucleotidyltransferase [Halanaeroarchaeum sp. HSR-CO]UWG47063.1 tRNA nucleotidyltransferase (CCA-adding enzyme) [Halanaeroarchaeum sp. HSR-CO]
MTGGDRFDEVVSAVRERVDPAEEERRRLQRTAATLVAEAEAVIDDLDVDADVLQVGSTARETWVSGDRDIDIFVRFDTSLTRAELERYGLQVGNRVLPDGREEYAEHPYVSGQRDGFDVDLVPCYRVDAATEIRSSVDRTPFHDRYLSARLTPKTAGDVRLFKQFLKGIRAYGSDLKTRGFSGYLTELLVLEYGGFEAVLDAASAWQPPVRLDPEEHGSTTFDDPLVVIDPTDPDRNVAAVVDAKNVARLQHYAREFLAEPSVDRCFPDDFDPLTEADIRNHLERRATTPLAIRFDPPDVVDDQLYPQLRRSLQGLRTGLEQQGFEILRSTVFADRTAVLFLELTVATRPDVERHEGPPVHVEEHARGFLEKYADSAVYGPFIDGDRYVVERERSITAAREFVETGLLDVALGAQVETALEDGYDVLEGAAVTALVPEFGGALARYFEPMP